VYYLGHQLGLPPSLALEVPDRKATATWLQQHARPGRLPETLFQQAEHYLLEQRILLPVPPFWNGSLSP